MLLTIYGLVLNSARKSFGMLESGLGASKV